MILIDMSFIACIASHDPTGCRGASEQEGCYDQQKNSHAAKLRI